MAPPTPPEKFFRSTVACAWIEDRDGATGKAPGRRYCGFDVVAEISAYRESGAFHPIYSLPGAAAEAALREIDGAGLDAVLMLGTGMPTLGPIAHVPYVGRAPVLSCMLCLVWRAVAHCDPAVASSAALIAWVEGRHWKPMLAQRQGA